MDAVKELLHRIINKKYGFCGLCLKIFLNTKDIVNFDDDFVVSNGNYNENIVKIKHIVTYIFGEETFNEVKSFKTICQECSISTLNAYNFIMRSKENFRSLTGAIETLVTSLEDIPDHCNYYSSLFLLLDPKLFTSNMYFVSEEKIKNLHELSNPEPMKKKVEMISGPRGSVNQKPKLKQCNNKCSIKLQEFGSTMIESMNIKCKSCVKEFATMERVKMHYLRVHAPKVFQCMDCPKRFAANKLLRTHQKECHIDLTCSICGKEFNHKHTLYLHEKSHNSMRIVCQDCGRVYKNKDTFRDHIKNNICQTALRNSPANAKFTCDHCGKKYSHKVSLRGHILLQHMNSKSYNCLDCDKKFSCQSRLKAHSVKHTRERNFTCSVCNRRFVTKESLLYHTRIHTGDCPYQCRHCDQRFLSASRRLTHMKKYHLNKTVKCNICGCQFKSYHYMHKHKELHALNREQGQIENTNNQVEYSNDIVTYKDGLQNVEGADSNTELIYQLTEAECQQIDVSNEVYLKLEENGNSYVFKV